MRASMRKGKQMHYAAFMALLILITGCSQNPESSSKKERANEHFMQSEVDALKQAREIKALTEQKSAEREKAAEDAVK